MAATAGCPIFENQPVQAIGALAVSLADPAVVWAGTGEAWAIRDSDVMGDGIYKSTDAGKTWNHMGLGETGRIGKIVTHPTNPDIAYVCAAGRITGPQQERGVYRTMDGGKTWEQVLFVDKNTSCSGLDIDPKNSRKLIAGTWQVEMHPWAMLSGGPGSGIYISNDAGTTWKRVESPGLPNSPRGQDRRRHRSHRFEPRVRAHPDRRSGLGVAFGRRRRPAGAR